MKFLTESEVVRTFEVNFGEGFKELFKIKKPRINQGRIHTGDQLLFCEIKKTVLCITIRSVNKSISFFIV